MLPSERGAVEDGHAMPDDESLSSFRHELRHHLLVIEHKVDALTLKVDQGLHLPSVPSRQTTQSAPMASPAAAPGQPRRVSWRWFTRSPGSGGGAASSRSRAGGGGTAPAGREHLDFVLPGSPQVASPHGASRGPGGGPGAGEAGRGQAWKAPQPPARPPPAFPSSASRGGPRGGPGPGEGDRERAWEDRTHSLVKSHTTANTLEVPVTQLDTGDSRRSSKNLSSVELGSVSRSVSNISGMHHDTTQLSGERKSLGHLRSRLQFDNDDDCPTERASAGVLGNLAVRSRRVLINVQDTADTRWAEAQEFPFFKLVHGFYFQLCSSTMIVVNVLLIGIIAEVRLQASISRTQEGPEWESIETAFAIFFGIELLLRLLAERTLFVLGPEWRWNLFDSLLVLLSLIDHMVKAAANGGAARVLRFVRFIRIVRIARAVRAFQSLRIVVFAIFESLMSLVWCLVVVGLIIWMFAIFFLYGVTEYIQQSGADEDVKDQLLTSYGSLSTAVVTLFMTISGGIDWRDAVDPLKAVDWYYAAAFIAYVFFMVFGVLNVVVGAFVATTAEISSRDREFLVRHEISQLQQYTRKIKTFFTEADKDKDKLLSWGEFKAHLKVPKVQAYFRALELDVSQAHVLFKLLDRDGSNEVSLDEFLAGCIRLKGQARSLEVNMLLYENKRLFQRLTEFMEGMGQTMGNVSDDLLGQAQDNCQRRLSAPIVDD